MTFLHTIPSSRPSNNKSHSKANYASHSQQNTRGVEGHRRRQPRFSVGVTDEQDDKALIAIVENYVEEGRQKDLTDYFAKYKQVPSRVGDWELRVNVRHQDNVPVSRTVVAIPLSVPAREIFRKGCMATLQKAGFDEESAKLYYAAAWRKKYVWVDSVIAAVKEMIDELKNVSVLESFEQAGDPRRLASTVSVPKNPYLTSHAHFLVAVEMAKAIIAARQNGTDESDNA